MDHDFKIKVPPEGEQEPENEGPGLFGSQAKPRRQPTSLFAGPAGIRLLVMCLMLLMVVWAMKQSGKPETWNWLFKFDKVEVKDDSAGGVPSQSTNIDTTLPNFDETTTNEKLDDEQPDDNESDWAPETIPGAEADSSDARADSFERSFWKTALKRLDGKEQTILYSLIECSAKQKSLPSGDTSESHNVLKKLRRWREKFHESFAENPELQNKLSKRWSVALLPSFEAINQDSPNARLISPSVTELPSLVSEVAFDTIANKTPVGRSREAYAWFAAWGEVFDAPIDQGSGEPATIAQLLAQPKQWRGENIHIFGTALRTERVAASHNSLGIQWYNIVWIQPDHPSMFPYCVYSLMLPNELACPPDQKTREVNLRIETSARFFKNRIFSSGKDGQASFAPLLLTATVQLVPVESVVATRKPFRLPGQNVTWLTMGILAGFAALIAWSVYRSTLGSKSLALPQSQRLEKNFTLLQDDERVETTIEKLQRISRASMDEPTEPTIESVVPDPESFEPDPESGKPEPESDEPEPPEVEPEK